jgi:hypothetical protein
MVELSDSHPCDSGYQKLLLLQIIGEIYGHHTLTGLLSSVGINPSQSNKHWQRLSYKKIWTWFEWCIRCEFRVAFEALLSKSESSWSRQNITVIGDDSVFRQWLSGESKTDDEYYQKSYSGQFAKSVWGYQLSVWGVMMDDRFYPLVIKVLKSSQTSTSVAEQCVDELADFLNEISQSQQKPAMFWSVDAGFNDSNLLQKIEERGGVPICVPKDNHIITYNDKKLNIKALKGIFEKKEKKYLEKNETKDTFCWRIRVTYRMHQREVVLLLFRLKGSKKVSVVFCFDKQVQEKSLRRHWFARTAIEQFFRLLKTTVRIQESVSNTFEGFIKKFVVACLKACFILQIRNRVRKTIKAMKKATWANIRRILAFDLGVGWLEKRAKNHTFCTSFIAK